MTFQPKGNQSLSVSKRVESIPVQDNSSSPVKKVSPVVVKSELPGKYMKLTKEQEQRRNNDCGF